MPAYVIADIEVKDAAAYEAYRKGVEATLLTFAGRFLVRGGAVTRKEGTWAPRRLVVLEFPDMAALEAWYGSADYKPLLDLRIAATSSQLVAVEGV